MSDNLPDFSHELITAILNMPDGDYEFQGRTLVIRNHKVFGLRDYNGRIIVYPPETFEAINGKDETGFNPPPFPTISKD